MAKTTTRFVCQACGGIQPKWMGKCPECGEWNSLVEEVQRAAPTSLAQSLRQGGGAFGRGNGDSVGFGTGVGDGVPSASFSYMGAAKAGPRSITEIETIHRDRDSTFIGEFDRVLGGGVVPGSLVLIGGDPGIGKCLTGDCRILDPQTGDFSPLRDRADAPGNFRPALALDGQTYRLAPRAVAAFHDNGVLPVVRVRTRLGRTLRCTPTHPVLTPEGWRPVGELAPGTRIAAPRALPFFGNEAMDPDAVTLLAYALSDGSTGSAVGVTTMLGEVADDLTGIAARAPA